MKRTKINHLQKSDFAFDAKWLKNSLRLSAVATGAALLSGCDSEDGYIYKSVTACELDNPGYDDRCESAYQKALADWKRTAPRYRSESNCAYDFGNHQCFEYSPYFIPLMTGFMLGDNHRTEEDFDLDFDRPRGLSYSTRRGTPAFHRWVSSSGDMFGDYHKNKVKVSSSAFKGSKGSARVMGRGGFGKTISSRSFGG